MFEIKKTNWVGPLGDNLMVIDYNRAAWLQRICSINISGAESSNVFKLVWDGRAIPFECLSETKHDQNEKIYLIKRFRYFGTAERAEAVAGIPPYEFADKTERRVAMLLATEAVLAFGSLYNGSEYLNGDHRVEFEGRLYTKSDFGLP